MTQTTKSYNLRSTTKDYVSTWNTVTKVIGFCVTRTLNS